MPETDRPTPVPAAARPRLSPYLVVRDPEAAIAFYVAVFGARELFRLVGPDGRIGHAELALGDAVLMLSAEYPDFGALAPHAVGGSPVKLHLAVDDVDRVFAAALAAGASELRPVADQFYGERSGMFADPAGHLWFVATTIEAVSPAEMQRRWDEGA